MHGEKENDRLYAILGNFKAVEGELVYAHEETSCFRQHRLKHNQDISMKTVNDLCRILDCEIDGIARYVPSDKDQAL